MARYVLIEFDDDAAADTLCARINDAAQKGKPYRLVGLFQRPRKLCMCVPDKTQMRKRIKRGGKLGWWVCTECRRPRLGDHQLNNLIKGEGMDKTMTSEGIDFFSMNLTPQEWYFRPESLSINVLPRKPRKRFR